MRTWPTNKNNQDINKYKTGLANKSIMSVIIRQNRCGWLLQCYRKSASCGSLRTFYNSLDSSSNNSCKVMIINLI